MPWKVKLPMNQKTQFISEYLRDSHSVSEPCQRYHIPRKTSYKWIGPLPGRRPRRTGRPLSPPEFRK
jgi:hypothetical protein